MRKKVAVFLALAALGLLGLVGASLIAIVRGGGATWAALLVIGLAVFTFLFLWQGWMLVRQHFQTLERLKGALVSLAGNPSGRLPRLSGLREDDDPGLEIQGLHAALAALEARRAEDRTAPDDRLQAVLASSPDALLVITEDGQVSLVNHAAKALLGAERVALGTSVYAALSRTSLGAAMARAREAGQPVDAMIGSLEGHQLTAKVASLAAHGGGVISIPAEEVDFRAELDVALELHDRLPPVGAFDDGTELAELPILVLDTETTGLQVDRDRVVSIGAVRLVGGRIYRATAFDRLVNPGLAIPPRSTAVHGITDAMVMDAPAFPEVYEALSEIMAGTLVVGHQVAFDLAILRSECARTGCPWNEPRSLDTLLLSEMLLPGVRAASLETIAGELGVDIHGRHTALGDSLVTAEVFASLLPRLADQGIVSLGQAFAFSRRAKRLVQAQVRAGW